MEERLPSKIKYVLNADNTSKATRITTNTRIETNFFRKSFILKAQQVEVPCKKHCYLILLIMQVRTISKDIPELFLSSPE
jgi:hypothetical protein